MGLESNNSPPFRTSGIPLRSAACSSLPLFFDLRSWSMRDSAPDPADAAVQQWFGSGVQWYIQLSIHFQSAISMVSQWYQSESGQLKFVGSLNVPIEHHPTIRYMVYNGYYKVMSNIPKMGHLPTPEFVGISHCIPGVFSSSHSPVGPCTSAIIPGRPLGTSSQSPRQVSCLLGYPATLW